MLNGIMTAISVLMILGGVYIVAEAFMSDSTFMRTHKRTDELLVSACNGIARCLGVKPNQPSLSAYERDCKKYADTLPEFSDETKRVMRREGYLPKGRLEGYPPTTLRFEGRDTMQEPYSSYMRRRYGQIASVKPNNETEAMRQMKALQDKVRKLNSAGVYIGYDSHPMDKSPYAPRIVREVVEVEEIEITSKSSAEITVEGFERRYYKPIEEPDILRILLDKT